MLNQVGKPIANAVIHVRNDTSGRDIEHDVTSGERAEYLYLSMFTANNVTGFVMNGWNVIMLCLCSFCY